MTTHLIPTADKALQATPGVSQATGRANPARSHSATNTPKSKTKANPHSIEANHPKGSAKPSLSAPSPASDPTRPPILTQQIPAFSPLYQQIKALILQSLRAGEWRPGEPIPSESELAARYQVSQGTVRKAIDELSMDNLLIRKQGIGTFVATHHEEQVQYRFLKLVPNERVHLSKPNVPPTRHILWCKSAKASAEVAQNLGLSKGEAVIHIRRILSFDSKATILEDLFLPQHPFQGLNADELRLYPGPTYGLFETRFGVRMVRAQEKIRAISASAKDAELLQVPIGAALLSVQRVSYTYQDIPMELRKAVYCTDRHHYQNELN
jgi:GntR family transcriptional regulator